MDGDTEGQASLAAVLGVAKSRTQLSNWTAELVGRSVLSVHWKDWCWTWNSNTLAIWCKSWLIWKDPGPGKDWRQEEKGMTEDEMVGWPHRLNGHESEWTLGVGDGQGGLMCCNSRGCKELDTTEWLNWTELNWCQFYPCLIFHPWKVKRTMASSIFPRFLVINTLAVLISWHSLTFFKWQTFLIYSLRNPLPQEYGKLPISLHVLLQETSLKPLLHLK